MGILPLGFEPGCRRGDVRPQGKEVKVHLGAFAEVLQREGVEAADQHQDPSERPLSLGV